MRLEGAWDPELFAAFRDEIDAVCKKYDLYMSAGCQIRVYKPGHIEVGWIEWFGGIVE